MIKGKKIDKKQAANRHGKAPQTKKGRKDTAWRQQMHIAALTETTCLRVAWGMCGAHAGCAGSPCIMQIVGQGGMQAKYSCKLLVLLHTMLESRLGVATPDACVLFHGHSEHAINVWKTCIFNATPPPGRLLQLVPCILIVDRVLLHSSCMLCIMHTGKFEKPPKNVKMLEKYNEEKVWHCVAC